VSTVALQWSTPALGLAFAATATDSRDRDSSPESYYRQILYWCVAPLISTSDATRFNEEFIRRLPLFSGLRVKFLEQAVESGASGDLKRIGEIIAAWSEGLDDVTRAELALANVKFQQGAELLAKSAESSAEHELDVAEVIGATVVVELLMFCMYVLAKRGEHPPVSAQIVHAFRYGSLDLAAAARRVSEQDTASTNGGSGDSEFLEEQYWTRVATLPINDVFHEQ